MMSLITTHHKRQSRIFSSIRPSRNRRIHKLSYPTLFHPLTHLCAGLGINGTRVHKDDVLAALGCKDPRLGSKVDGFDMLSLGEDSDEQVDVFSDVAGGFSDDNFAVLFVFCDESLEEGVRDVVDV